VAYANACTTKPDARKASPYKLAHFNNIALHAHLNNFAFHVVSPVDWNGWIG